MFSLSKKEQRTVILGVTIGTILEWYEIYLFVYWAPIISHLFFNSNSDIINLIDTFLLFGIGFLARPLGGILFGRLGDRIGRKKSLILSIIVMTFPTFTMGLLPTYAQIGVAAPILLGLMRLLQAFPAGGESPGAFCFLYESADVKNRKYLTSWGAVGNQIGVIISMLECYFLEKYLSPEDLIAWGWRISFMAGGIIGLSGFYLRYKLHETPLFKELAYHHKITPEPISKVIYKYKSGITKGILFCVLDAASFYLISTLFPEYFNQIIGYNHTHNLILSILIILLMTVPLPFFGMLGDRFNYKSILIYSTLGVISLTFPLYLSIHNLLLTPLVISGFLFIILITCITALIPYLLTDLFPTSIRFTCVGLSFNIVDGVIGGFTPVIALYLLRATGNNASFSWFILFCALISFGSYFMIKDTKLNKNHTS